ncbi:hypothetical protein SAMN04488029_0701 [Reichenbachiella faecimaris]|uniref:Outer membrane protein beta-barrel domain-containing protein n=1 Tax=Reichenbachiella faecimaris TaxID=692418 RepID=A0A1W2G7U2_REIFA|nr:hypothetical protein [Reichenbachiella faecimaris]SMD32356.1 hypothetical protein SAMN04488029_0701 [Reichenbachiella faecimaris]
MEKANSTFEEQWSQSLANAEVTPPEQVWVAIDGHLANEQALVYKKQADFYRWVAAACLFLITLGGAFFWMNDTSEIPSDLAKNEDRSVSRPSLEENAFSSSKALILEEEDKVELKELDQAIENVQPTLVNASAKRISTPVLTQTEPAFIPSTGTKQVKSLSRYAATHQTVFNALSAKSVELASAIEPWEAEHLFGVARTWETIAPSKVVSPLWAGVSFSTGSFDPGFGKSSGGDMAFASQEGISNDSFVRSQTANPVYASGQSVAGGLNLGKKFANRIVISSGLHYSAFNTGSSSSQLVSDQQDNTYALTNERNDSNLESALSDGNLRYEGQQVQLANEYQYLTIPIKAGYVLLDNKFNITLNTGLSSNILVDSKLVSESDAQNLNNDFSTSGSYESVYFNFLTSVEFGYIFKRHYQLLLEPNYNQALTEFTNANHTDKAKPKNLGIAIGFRYNF